jgi:hypothetical protein
MGYVVVCLLEVEVGWDDLGVEVWSERCMKGRTEDFAPDRPLSSGRVLMRRYSIPNLDRRPAWLFSYKVPTYGIVVLLAGNMVVDGLSRVENEEQIAIQDGASQDMPKSYVQNSNT